jgi:hypothetical protein
MAYSNAEQIRPTFGYIISLTDPIKADPHLVILLANKILQYLPTAPVTSLRARMKKFPFWDIFDPRDRFAHSSTSIASIDIKTI